MKNIEKIAELSEGITDTRNASNRPDSQLQT